MSSSTDRIERKVVLKATRARVWQALTNIEEFNSWFRVRYPEKRSRRARSIPATSPIRDTSTSYSR